MVFAAFAAFIALLMWRFTDNSTDLTPGHSGDVLAVGACAAVATALVAFVLLVWLKPRLRGPSFVSAPVVAMCCGAIGGLLSMGAAERILQFVGFRGPTTRYERQFPIWRAYVSHAKGVSYHIQTARPFADFELESTDYAQVFGKREELRPMGYCLWATVEQNGASIRVMLPSVRPIPSGRMRPCPIAKGR